MPTLLELHPCGNAGIHHQIRKRSPRKARTPFARAAAVDRAHQVSCLMRHRLRSLPLLPAPAVPRQPVRYAGDRSHCCQTLHHLNQHRMCGFPYRTGATTCMASACVPTGRVAAHGVWDAFVRSTNQRGRSTSYTMMVRLSCMSPPILCSPQKMQIIRVQRFSRYHLRVHSSARWVSGVIQAIADGS